jgi:hypothetical protein
MITQRGQHDNEQYSRKSSLRIFGIPKEQGESCVTKVNNLLFDTMKLRGQIPTKIVEVAHRVGPRNQQGPRGMIVRLTRCEAKDTIIRSRKVLKGSRKVLKGSRIVVRKELTTANYEWLQSLKMHHGVRDAWSWNTKLFAKGKH